MPTPPPETDALSDSNVVASHWNPLRVARDVDLIRLAERCVYVVIGAMLVLVLVLALASACKALWDGLPQWSSAGTIVDIIDRLLFMLMLVEILHTVHTSIQTGALVCEPFLIVALIACIRRILVITLNTSQITQIDHWDAHDRSLFHASMVELGVLALLIVVLIGSIRVTRTCAKPVDLGKN